MERIVWTENKCMTGSDVSKLAEKIGIEEHFLEARNQQDWEKHACILRRGIVESSSGCANMFRFSMAYYHRRFGYETQVGQICAKTAFSWRIRRGSFNNVSSPFMYLELWKRFENIAQAPEQDSRRFWQTLMQIFSSTLSIVVNAAITSYITLLPSTTLDNRSELEC